jgi:hypothetical protein
MVSHGLFTAVYRVGGKSVWDLWWTKWHWDRLFSESFSFFPVNIITLLLHNHSSIIWGICKVRIKDTAPQSYTAQTQKKYIITLYDDKFFLQSNNDVKEEWGEWGYF